MSDVTPAGLRGAVDLSALVNRPAPGTPAGAPGNAGAPATGLIVDGTDANFAQFLELSMTVPVIVDLWAEWCGPCKQLSPILEKLVTEYAGRFVLVKVDVDSNPQLSQAFQAQSIPTVAALIGNRPVALFTGALPEQQVRDVFEQVLVLAEQNGVTGHVPAGNDAETESEAEGEPEPEPLPPLHQEAYDAIDHGDYDAAIAAYTTAIAQDPRDTLAVAGLAQVKLLARLADADADDARSAAAASPLDADAQLSVADLDLSGGHVDDALGRLLETFPRLDADGKNALRERMLDYFQIIGLDDPRVIRARARLTGLLY